MSCPSSYQSPGVSTSRSFWDIQDFNKGRRLGEQSRANKWRGIKDRMLSPAITPSFNNPRETLIPQSANIWVPATWHTTSCIACFVSKTLSQITRASNFRFFNVPRYDADSMVLLSVKK
jgi:hypothetical protein